jgi:hypothetical protein
MELLSSRIHDERTEAVPSTRERDTHARMVKRRVDAASQRKRFIASLRVA